MVGACTSELGVGGTQEPHPHFTYPFFFFFFLLWCSSRFCKRAPSCFLAQPAVPGRKLGWVGTERSPGAGDLVPGAVATARPQQQRRRRRSERVHVTPALAPQCFYNQTRAYTHPLSSPSSLSPPLPRTRLVSRRQGKALGTRRGGSARSSSDQPRSKSLQRLLCLAEEALHPGDGWLRAVRRCLLLFLLLQLHLLLGKLLQPGKRWLSGHARSSAPP